MSNPRPARFLGRAAGRNGCIMGGGAEHSQEGLSMSTNSGPGWKQHPDHRIATRPAGLRVQVTAGGDVIADTRDAIELQEATGDGKSTVAPVVYYIPRKDVRMDRLVRSRHGTYCPFKGQASYYSLADGPANAAWTYEEPYDEMLVIKDHLAFYPGKVDSITTS
jgi:uncharacterized protein (DUF427 family)